MFICLCLKDGDGKEYKKIKVCGEDQLGMTRAFGDFVFKDQPDEGYDQQIVCYFCFVFSLIFLKKNVLCMNCDEYI